MITKLSLETFFKKILIIAEENYDEFNSIDGQLGDGDLGITISKGLKEINENFNKFEDDLSKIFLLCAQCFTKASSSSFGTLVAISFMTVAKQTKGKTNLDIDELPTIINSVIDSNSTKSEGGGIISRRSHLKIINSKITNNFTKAKYLKILISNF